MDIAFYTHHIMAPLKSLYPCPLGQPDYIDCSSYIARFRWPRHRGGVYQPYSFMQIVLDKSFADSHASSDFKVLPANLPTAKCPRALRFSIA